MSQSFPRQNNEASKLGLVNFITLVTPAFLDTFVFLLSYHISYISAIIHT